MRQALAGGWRSYLFGPASAALAFAAFFLPSVPFALALLPLLVAAWSGLAALRAAAMAGFMLWPAIASATGLVGVGMDPGVAWAGAAGIVVALSLLAAGTGILPVTLALLALPVFPASPLLPLAALLPGAGFAGLIVTALALTVAETLRSRRIRTVLFTGIAATLAVWNILPGAPGAGATSLWREIPEPVTITERARWIALRDSLPEGGTASLGENIFRAEDADARAFWCRAAKTRNLTLFIGVSEPYEGVRRSALRRLDPETCARTGDATITRAGFGIPGVTGTWTLMEGDGTSAAHDPGFDVLICLEAFLPWAWVSLLTEDPRPVVVLSNDGAFGPVVASLPVLGSLPVSVLRRKAARAMAGLSGRQVHHAETGRTALLLSTPARPITKGQSQ